MKRIAALIACLAVLAALPARWPRRPGQAQETLTLTLDDSIRLALRQNPFYLAEKAKEDGASAVVREAVSGFFPSLNAQGTDVLDKKVFSITFPSFYPGRAADQGQDRLHPDLPVHPELQPAPLRRRPADVGLSSRPTSTCSRPRKASACPSRRPSTTSRRPSTASCWRGPSWTSPPEAVDLAEKHVKNVQNLYDVGMASKFDLLRSEVQAGQPQAAAHPGPQRPAHGRAGPQDPARARPEPGRRGQGRAQRQGRGRRTSDENIARGPGPAARAQPAPLPEAAWPPRCSRWPRRAYLPTLAIGGAYNYLGRQAQLRPQHLGELLPDQPGPELPHLQRLRQQRQVGPVQGRPQAARLHPEGPGRDGQVRGPGRRPEPAAGPRVPRSRRRRTSSRPWKPSGSPSSTSPKAWPPTWTSARSRWP